MCGDSRSPALGDYPQHLGADSFRSFEVYSVVTLMYLAISWMVMHVLNFISSRYLSYPVR